MFRPRRLVLLAALVTQAACSARSAPLPTLAPFAAPGCPDCARWGDVVIGGQPSPDLLRQLADSGFATIVSARTAAELDWDEQAVVESLGMQFVRIPIPLPLAPVTAAQVAAFDTALAEHPAPVFLHCAAGTRAAVLWALWLSERYAVDPTVTLQQAEEAGMRLGRPATERLLGAQGRHP